MANYAIVKDNVVINTCVWDGISDWWPPEGTTVVNIDNKTVGTGYSYINDEFIAPIVPEQVGEINDNNNYS